MSELNYPFVNVPPIVYNQHLAKTNVVSDTVEAYDNAPINAYSSHTNQPSITFLPLDKQMVAFQGELFHPDSHILTPNKAFHSRVKSNTHSNPKKEYSEEKVIPSTNSTTLYLLAIGSVGLIILNGLLSKSQY